MKSSTTYPEMPAVDKNAVIQTIDELPLESDIWWRDSEWEAG